MFFPQKFFRSWIILCRIAYKKCDSCKTQPSSDVVRILPRGEGFIKLKQGMGWE